ncbi:hypothetical protein F2P79_006620 [Pimephales promelas]|nr:hypothetical protein F2P79_006620 [Pimephales promelas]
MEEQEGATEEEKSEGIEENSFAPLLFASLHSFRPYAPRHLWHCWVCVASGSGPGHPVWSEGVSPFLWICGEGREGREGVQVKGSVSGKQVARLCGRS